MNKLQRYLLVGSIALATILPVASSAQAQLSVPASQALGTNVAARFGSFELIIKTAFNLTILLSGIVFVLLMLLGGVQYLTSLGEEDATTKARKIILNGAIGLVIVLSAFAIGTYVLSLLGLGSSGTLNTSDQNTGSFIQGGR